MSKATAIGYAVGLAVGIIIGIICLRFAFKRLNTDKQNTKYDERQIIVRGKAYMLSFWSLVIMLAIYSVFCTFVESYDLFVPIQTSLIPVLMILVSIVINCGYCIFNDGYFGVNSERKKWYSSITIIGVANIVIGLCNMLNNGFMEDGKLGFPFVNFACGFCFVIVGIMIFIKDRIDKNEEDADEEDDL
ncbi:MAG: hypothetical protein J5517_06740 [Eubacterium sp.]|nr:hypothetical protein [Eubacterium sp.]